MNLLLNNLSYLLIAAAVGQIMIAAINLRLDRLLHWDNELNNVSRLLREVFFVHKWFITIILVIFGALTIRFAVDMATGGYEMARWLAAGIGLFWGIRTLIQWTYYSTDHWKGNPARTAIHWILTFCYGGCATVYLVAAFR
ncbi:MAG: hypothetical protein P1V20_08965 [Verrucomicrobiales bacterium]|nr:hypothetical protein [Verrucomicrobiales bacterium]